ncbi:Zinc finger protein 91 [Plecturocebus cupreus]
MYMGQAQGLMPIIPALWEAKAGGSQGQEFETSLANMVFSEHALFSHCSEKQSREMKLGLALAPRPEYSGTIIVQCSLKLLGTGDPPTSSLQLPASSNPPPPKLLGLQAMRFHHDGQAGLELLTSALWEAEAGGSRGQEIETILANTVKPRLY